MLKKLSAIPKPDILLGLLIITFALFFSVLSIQQHRTFQTHGLDLGNVDQALWNTAHGRPLQFSLMWPVQNRLALHVEPILWLFVPFYWLGLGGPWLLLLTQASIVALGAWPLYRLARHQFEQCPYALLILPLSYLLYPPLQSAVLFEFHAVTLAPTLILCALLALQQNQPRRFLLFAILTMACKEDMPLLIALVGLLAGLKYHRWRLAALTISLSGLWFSSALFIIQPSFSAAGNIQLDRYAWLGDGPLAMARTALSNPGLLLNHLLLADAGGYVMRLSLPVALLNWLSPLLLLPTLPTLAINLLSDNPFTWRVEDFHYVAPLTPFIFVAALRSIARHAPRRPHFLLILLLLTSLFYHYQRGYTPLARPFEWPQPTPHQQRVADFLPHLPPTEPLFTQPNLAPHLSQRQFIYNEFAYFTAPDFAPPRPAAAILLDVTSLKNHGGLHEYLRQMLLTQPNYQLQPAPPGLLYLRQATTPPTTTFRLPPPEAAPQYPLVVDFGGLMQLHGYTLHFDREENVEVTIQLTARQPLPAELRPQLYLLTAEGEPLGVTTDLQPHLVWHPPAAWAPGERVALRFNTLPWESRPLSAYRLALGMVQGDDPWAVGQRLHPTLTQPTQIAPRLLAEGTLLELARIEKSWGMPRGGPQLRQFTPPLIPHPLAVSFAGQIELLGYYPPTISRETLAIRLIWRAKQPLTHSLTRFVQLLGPDGQLYGQHDSPPDNGHYPTTLWQPGEVVSETVLLPLNPERPAGVYHLLIGLYQPQTGARLPLTTGNDHVAIPLRE